MTNDRILKESIHHYEEASPFEQRLLQLCSVLYDAPGKTRILACYKKTGLPFPKEDFHKIQQITPYINSLIKRNLLDELLRCNPAILEFATRRAVEEGHYGRMVKAVLEEIPSKKNAGGYRYYFDPRDCPLLMRDFRIGVYTGNAEMILSNYSPFVDYKTCQARFPLDPFLQVLFSPFEAKWLNGLPHEIRLRALSVCISHGIKNMTPDQGELEYALDQDFLKAVPEVKKDAFCYLLATRLILGGRIAKARSLAGMICEQGTGYTGGLNAWLLFMEGKNNESIESYEADLKFYRKMIGGRNDYFSGMAGIFFILALLKTRAASQLSKIEKFLKKAHSYTYEYHFMPHILCALERICEVQQGNVDRAKETKRHSLPGDEGLGDFFAIFASYWLNNKISEEETRGLQSVFSSARRTGWKWLEMECANLLATRFKRSGADYEGLVEQVQRETGLVSILSMVPNEELWQKSLRALMESGGAVSRRTAEQGNTRLVWLFSADDHQMYLQPLEQKLGKNGVWSKGRNVALKRLLQGTNVSFITEQDRRIAQAIRVDSSYYSGTTYYFDREEAAQALIGHPLVFQRKSPSVSVTVEKGEPVVSVKKTGSHFKIEFSPDISGENVLVVEQSPTRYEVVCVNDHHRRIAGILGKNGLSIPLSGKDDLLSAIGAVSSTVAVHSSIDGASDDVSQTESDPVPRMQIFPMGEGFRLEMLVRPFGEEGPCLKPGTGNQTLIAAVHGKPMQTKRDLKRESAMADAVENACPSLFMFQEASRQWHLNAPEDCLQVLTELKALQDNHQVVMEWPKGETLRVTRPISFDRLRMKIRTGTDWFEVGGDLALDEDLVMDMTKLLDLVRDTKHRFVPLGDNLFAALTEEFRKKLTDLDAYSYRKGGAVRFHPLSALLLEEFAANLPEVEADKEWHQKLERLKEIENSVPALPSTLKAQLRGYQETGYRWMTRLAQWGVGACLADDMGLGKTVQALAVLLDRAPGGPALIVAPTSVCHNWIAEANRFAPTLHPIPFGGRERQALVDGLQGFDVLVSSYGLLQQETDLLTSITWNTVVLDEAQAIKNITAKRSQAAMNLKGHFRIITTGTPIENHLGELWSLFNFINPGLLGSLNRFNERFALPIERNGDRETKKRLKKLIQPFILRRVKTDVLEELPPRTEVTLHVELDPEEAAFYEALRQTALQKLEQDTGAGGQKHLKILAEITRLRRACCHPRLILPDSPLAGAKLNLFDEVVSELLENRHKALVFSQFVGHLDILRKHLDAKKVNYRYLDGSTLAAERQVQVERFQKGDGDLFLISLKAGGLGLNLTAASYVIHMDPWWNPAVEDQASDRAHRIGQQHPVTVYRLVARGTIEEKIIALHQKKRDLADSLLDGTDVAGKISAEELLALIRED